jgi:hypothetical protein
MVSLISRQNGSRAISIGNSHVRGVATELQQRLRKSFEVIGRVNPGSNTGTAIFSTK